MVLCEGRFVLILFLDIDMPLFSVRLQCHEDFNVAQIVNTLFHPRTRIPVPNFQNIKASIFDTKP